MQPQGASKSRCILQISKIISPEDLNDPEQFMRFEPLRDGSTTKISNMISINNKIEIDLNGYQPSCQEHNDVENKDDCDSTFLSTDYDDQSSCSLSEEELNEILRSLGEPEIFGNESDMYSTNNIKSEHKRLASNEGSTERTCGENVDLTDEDTERIKNAAIVLQRDWEKRCCRLDQKAQSEIAPLTKRLLGARI
eukprot:15364991-Ditylum_brightwellii.AAC.1